MSYTEQRILSKVDILTSAFAAATGTTVTPKELSDANDTLEAGYYEATTLSAVDAGLATENIKSGITIFGISGKSEVVDTTIAADFAIAGRLKTGDKAYTNGALITGDGTKTLDPLNDTVAAGYYAATTLSTVDTDLASANIKSGVTIFGKAGAATVQEIGASNAAVGEVLATKTFFSATGPIKTGTMPNNAGDVEAVSSHAGATTHIHIIPATGYTNGTTDAVVLDLTSVTTIGADLVTGNIKAGVAIFGVMGKTEVVDTTEAVNGAVAGDIAAGKFAWVNGVRIEGTLV